MAAEVEGDDAEPIDELGAERSVHRGAEAGGMGHEQRLSRAPELVDGDLHAVGAGRPSTTAASVSTVVTSGSIGEVLADVDIAAE